MFGKSQAGEPGEFVAQHLIVGEVDAAPLSLTTSPGATLNGRIVIEGAAGQDNSTFSLEPVPADFDGAPLDGRGATVATKRAGYFTMTGLAGPMRFLLSGAPAGWYLKSVIVNHTDITDTGFDFGFWERWLPDARIVISGAGATLRGRVVDGTSRPVSEYTVLVFPRNRAKRFPHSRYFRFARPSQDDSFEVAGLPPGDYWVAAAESIDATAGGGEWQDPEVLETLAVGAQRVIVGERDVVDLTLRCIRR